MVRPSNTVRSRGCAACRKKRIKCDLGIPSCQRCLERGWTCPGPETGLFIVSVDSSNYRNPPIRKKSRSNEDTALLVKDVSGPGSLYDDALLWKFLSFFSQNAGRRTWFSNLPILIKPDHTTALRTAVRAVSLAYAAQSVNNPSATAVAYQLYGKSLQQHRISLANLPCLRPACPITVYALSVTVLLSYFEMIFATSADAWIRHTEAAEQLIAVLEDEAMKDDFLNHLYYIIRSHAAVRKFLYGGHSELSGRKWLQMNNISPCGPGWNINDTVLGLIMWLSDAVTPESRGPVEDKTVNDVPPLDKTTLEATLEELEQLWDRFGDIFGLDTAEYPLLPKSTAEKSPPAQNIPDASLDLDYPYVPLMTASISSQSTNYHYPPLPSLPSQLQNPTAALTGSFFSAAAILALHLLDQVSSNAGVYQTQIAAQSTRALQMATYQATQHIGCTCTRTMLPICAVYRFSPVPNQRRHAEQLFREWCKADGLPGLISVAFPERNSSIEDPARMG